MIGADHLAQQLVTVVWSTLFVVTGLVPWYAVRRRDRAERIVSAAAYLGLIAIMTWILAAYRQPVWWPIPLGLVIGTAIVIEVIRSVRLD
jgi:hypothetical protein